MSSTPLPPDDHVHSEWSWDAHAGSMERSCARAVELGLPAIAFTEHVDHTRWVTPRASQVPTGYAHLVDGDGRLSPPPLDVDGYLAALDRCRSRYPELRIVSGVELGEPHWSADQVDALLSTGSFERILGSQHSILVDDEPWLADDPEWAPPGWSPDDILRAHLAETLRMVEACDGFAVLAHIDYAVRAWPDDEPFAVADFEEEFRAVLHALAGSGRTLEVNTVVPLAADIVGWWREVGGKTVSFASDAHRPAAVGRGFADAAAMVEASGFEPGRDPHDLWHR